MLPDDFYLTCETDNGTSPRHIPFYPSLVGSQWMSHGSAGKFLAIYYIHSDRETWIGKLQSQGSLRRVIGLFNAEGGRWCTARLSFFEDKRRKLIAGNLKLVLDVLHAGYLFCLALDGFFLLLSLHRTT